MNTSPIPKEQMFKLQEKLERERFYGLIETHFENGRIYRVRKIQSIQRDELERMTDS